MQQRLILIVDHDRSTRTMYADYFRHHGYAVAEAAFGAEGVRLFRQLRPDLIVTELSLEPDWVETLRTVRTNNRFDTIIIACCASIDPGCPFSLDGVDRALSKPTSPRALLLEAEQLLGERSALAGCTAGAER
jgi:CheY-like chemotaxis protein